MSMTLHQLAAALGATCAAPEPVQLTRTLRQVSGCAQADAQALVFAETPAALDAALASSAGAVLLTPALADGFATSKPLLLHAQPRWAFAQAARLLRAPLRATGVHPTAILGAHVHLGAQVSIGPYAVLGANVSIGDRTHVGAGAVLGDGVRIGTDGYIHPRVVVYSGTQIGNRVILHAGCVLGSDGFGYARHAETGAYLQFPQQGTLVVEDDVEVGANTTIDRGALEETRIARGSKLDNLVHIGHNVRVGRDVVIAAQTGISGSSSVGDGAILGGQVGVGEHAEIGPQVILGGGAGVLSQKKLRGPGAVFWGRPAQPLREYLKSLAALARLTRRAKE
jgi:UDP-3-O-[3-hydroxymyristoyl] glucosamine N-acyltransferase